MVLDAILKRIVISNSDLDSYYQITFDLNTIEDLNLLNQYKHKPLTLIIEDNEEHR